MVYDDPKTYRKMSEPIPAAEAEANLTKFHEGVQALRIACHIQDLALIASVVIEDSESENGEATRATVILCGSQAGYSTLSAYLYGNVQEMLQDSLARSSQRGRKAVKNKPPPPTVKETNDDECEHV